MIVLQCGSSFIIHLFHILGITSGVLAAMDPLLENEPLRLKCGNAAGQYIQSHLGGTQLIYDHIFNHSQEEG